MRKLLNAQCAIYCVSDDWHYIYLLYVLLGASDSPFINQWGEKGAPHSVVIFMHCKNGGFNRKHKGFSSSTNFTSFA